MTAEQLTEARTKLAELETLNGKIVGKIQENTELARRLNAENRDLMAQRQPIAEQIGELRRLLEPALPVPDPVPPTN